MTAWELHEKLTDLIDLLIDYHPQGFSVLLGETPPPTSLEVHRMCQAQRAPEEIADVKNATPNLTSNAERIVWDAEKFDATVERAYGWKHIVEVCRGYKEANPKLWAVVVDHARYVGNSVSRVGSQLGYVSVRHGMAPNSITRYRREFPVKLARAILCPPVNGGDFQLMPG